MIVVSTLITFLLIYLLGLFWYDKPFKSMNWLYHGILRIHSPITNGALTAGRCSICWERIWRYTQHERWKIKKDGDDID